MWVILASAAATAASTFCLPRASPEQVLQPPVLGSTRWDVSAVHLTEGHRRSTHSAAFYASKPSRKNICAALDSGNKLASENAESYDLPPPGCVRVKVELSKPLGMVLEEDKSGNIFVAEIVEGGNADKCGLVDVGDQLIATSAIVYGTEEYYQGVRVRKGMQVVRLSVFGEKFETVMAAIGTHPAHVKVALEIQKCARPTITTESNGAAN